MVSKMDGVYINDRGSFTLTSGILSQDPVPGGSALSMVNAGIDGFAIGAAIDMPRGIRINSVSPGMVLESMSGYASYFRGYEIAGVVEAIGEEVTEFKVGDRVSSIPAFSISDYANFVRM
jgi:NAD(P)-dependent dehydrogenase (short-subunit alcohol dehydrogenase family)